ncbi:MAG: flagellar basal body-associated FliL family protein [Pseudomonadota bacterium]
MPSDATADTEIETGDDEAPEKKKLSGKKMVLIAAPVLLLLIGGAAVYFLGLLDPILGSEEEMATEEMVMEPLPVGHFHDLPDLIVNLKSTGRKPTFLKLAISLELETPEDVPSIRQVMPRIIDNFQLYLRELRIEDLQGSQGLHRLREELLRRVTAAARPITVRDVLFREMLIQ